MLAPSTLIVNNSWKVCSSARAEAITNLVVDWISVNSCPISIVEDTGLQQLFGYMKPAYSLPSCTHVASIVEKCHTKAKKVKLIFWRKKPILQP